MAKAKAMLPLTKLIYKEKSLYTDIFDEKDLAGINKKMPDKNKATEMPKIKLITSESKHTICIFL